MQSKPIFYYFPLHGRGEATRILFHVAKVDFEDTRTSMADWPALKASGKFEFGQVPGLEIDGKVMVQQMAILRYLGRKYGFYPSEPMPAYEVDSLLDGIYEFFCLYPYVTLFFNQGATDDEKKNAREKFFESIEKYFTIFENRLKKNSSQEFFVGNNWTLADFLFLACYFSIFAQPGNKERFETEYAKFPVLKNYLEKRLEALGDYSAKKKLEFL